MEMKAQCLAMVSAARQLSQAGGRLRKILEETVEDWYYPNFCFGRWQSRAMRKMNAG
jgi:hypothetical protein